MYRAPATHAMPSGGLERAACDWVVYQTVAPRCPDVNCRSCLKGTNELVVVTVEVDEDGRTTGGVDRSKVRVLEWMSAHMCRKEPKASLTVQ